MLEKTEPPRLVWGYRARRGKNPRCPLFTFWLSGGSKGRGERPYS